MPKKFKIEPGKDGKDFVLVGGVPVGVIISTRPHGPVYTCTIEGAKTGGGGGNCVIGRRPEWAAERARSTGLVGVSRKRKGLGSLKDKTDDELRALRRTGTSEERAAVHDELYARREAEHEVASGEAAINRLLDQKLASRQIAFLQAATDQYLDKLDTAADRLILNERAHPSRRAAARLMKTRIADERRARESR